MERLKLHMGRKVKESSKLKIGSVYTTKYYGSIEVIQDDGCKEVTVKFLDTGYIREGVNRSNVIRGQVKDPSVSARFNDHKKLSGERSENSYLVFKGKVTEREHKYFCRLCNNENITVKKYTESNIPISCGCIGRLQPQGKDLTGLELEGIQVIGYSCNGKWRVVFSCGHSYDVATNNIKGRASSECKECSSKRPTTLDHGHAKRSGYSPEYTSWLGMRRRCDDEKNNRYKFYKGKGIDYPEEWKDFNIFLKDMGKKPSAEYSIERLDVNKSYSVENCVWADKKTQANNKTSNIRITNKVTEEVMSLKHWCDLENIDYKKAHYRFRYKGECVTEILGDNYEITLDSHTHPL